MIYSATQTQADACKLKTQGNLMRKLRSNFEQSKNKGYSTIETCSMDTHTLDRSASAHLCVHSTHALALTCV